MNANLFDTGFVAGVVGLDNDFASVFEKTEMVSGEFMGKSHDVVTTGGNSLLASVGSGRRTLLGKSTGGKKGQEKR